MNPPQLTLPVKFLVSDPGIKVESLSTYEEMTIDELFNGPSLMETQPDLEGEKDDYPYSQREIAKMTERQRKYEEGEPDLEQLQKEIGNETKELYLYPIKTSPFLTTFFFSIKDRPLPLPALSTLEVFRANRL